jgi:hypothetical protein
MLQTQWLKLHSKQLICTVLNACIMVLLHLWFNCVQQKQHTWSYLLCSSVLELGSWSVLYTC